MSVVCAKVYKDKIVVAADSIMVFGQSKTQKSIETFAKMVKINGMVIGGVGTAQETSILFHYMKTHKLDAVDEKSVLDFMLEFHKWKRDLTGDSTNKNDYILAYGGKCFYIENHFVAEVTDYIAIGAGMNYATAALHLGHSPREAVKVANELCCYCCDPIIEETVFK